MGGAYTELDRLTTQKSVWPADTRLALTAAGRAVRARFTALAEEPKRSLHRLSGEVEALVSSRYPRSRGAWLSVRAKHRARRKALRE